MFDFDDRALGFEDSKLREPAVGAPSALVAGVDYPRSAGDLAALYPNEVACRRLLESLRWGTGFVCPQCGSSAEPWRSSLALVACTECRQLSSAVSGTLLSGSSKPLALWFHAAWEIVSRDTGVAIGAIEQALQVQSEATAWVCLEKLRGALVQYERDRLRSLCEVDECYVRIEVPGATARREGRRAVVAVALEIDGSRIGRVRLRAVSGERLSNLALFVAETVAPGTPVCTDRVRGYAPLRSMGYDHVVTRPNAAPDPSRVEMPNVARIVPLLQAWLDATSPIPVEHLGYYLDEWAFRFNQRAQKPRGLLFRSLLARAVGGPDAPPAAAPGSERPRKISGVRAKVSDEGGAAVAATGTDSDDADAPPRSVAALFAAAAGRIGGGHTTGGSRA